MPSPNLLQTLAKIYVSQLRTTIECSCPNRLDGGGDRSLTKRRAVSKCPLPNLLKSLAKIHSIQMQGFPECLPLNRLDGWMDFDMSHIPPRDDILMLPRVNENLPPPPCSLHLSCDQESSQWGPFTKGFALALLRCALCCVVWRVQFVLSRKVP